MFGVKVTQQVWSLNTYTSTQGSLSISSLSLIKAQGQSKQNVKIASCIFMSNECQMKIFIIMVVSNKKSHIFKKV